MKNIFFTLLALWLLPTTAVQAQKKRAAKPQRNIQALVRCDSASFTNRKGGVRMIGHVYELYLTTRMPNIVIDSVWFGATPVPCDVYDLSAGMQADTAKKPGRYLLKVNRDLYRNFPDMTDSSHAFRTFRPPFLFKGDAMVMYRYKGKRYYLPVYRIEQRYDRVLRQ